MISPYVAPLGPDRKTFADDLSDIIKIVMEFAPAIRGIKSPGFRQDLLNSPRADLVLLLEDNTGKKCGELVIQKGYPTKLLETICPNLITTNLASGKQILPAWSVYNEAMIVITTWLLEVVSTLEPEAQDGELQLPCHSVEILGFQHLLAYWRVFSAMGHAPWTGKMEKLITRYIKQVALQYPEYQEFFWYVDYHHPMCQVLLESMALLLTDDSTPIPVAKKILGFFHQERPRYLWRLVKLQAETGDEKAIDRFDAMKARQVESRKKVPAVKKASAHTN
ncbi:hypothetical protein BT63DRAFT_452266 [Microthyrium microscopicum]|uniref:Uncharacterized protein n=1 Tax=Microthyrium microscopicum TaxID=703497 RepID=A0A6A6UIZ9_9PEZI|nr:hypothetical protein BT63DRAFT_452266 [Microthyrium microscopicum]